MTIELGVLLALLVQTAAVVYWGGKIAASVQHHDREIERLRARWHDGIVSLLQEGLLVLDKLAIALEGKKHGDKS